MWLDYSNNLQVYTFSKMQIEAILWSNKEVTTCIPESTVSYLRWLKADKLHSSIGTATLVGFGPLNLSLIILSRKVLTEYRCQRHVKSPTWRTSELERSNSRHQASLTSETTGAKPSSGRWKYGREISENFVENSDFHVTFGFFYMP